MRWCRHSEYGYDVNPAHRAISQYALGTSLRASDEEPSIWIYFGTYLSCEWPPIRLSGGTSKLTHAGRRAPHRYRSPTRLLRQVDVPRRVLASPASRRAFPHPSSDAQLTPKRAGLRTTLLRLRLVLHAPPQAPHRRLLRSPHHRRRLSHRHHSQPHLVQLLHLLHLHRRNDSGAQRLFVQLPWLRPIQRSLRRPGRSDGQALWRLERGRPRGRWDERPARPGRAARRQFCRDRGRDDCRDGVRDEFDDAPCAREQGVSRHFGRVEPCEYSVWSEAEWEYG